MDALPERLKIVIPELMELNHKDLIGDELPFMLDGVRRQSNTSGKAGGLKCEPLKAG